MYIVVINQSLCIPRWKFWSWSKSKFVPTLKFNKLFVTLPNTAFVLWYSLYGHSSKINITSLLTKHESCERILFRCLRLKLHYLLNMKVVSVFKMYVQNSCDTLIMWLSKYKYSGRRTWIHIRPISYTSIGPFWIHSHTVSFTCSTIFRPRGVSRRFKIIMIIVY